MTIHALFMYHIILTWPWSHLPHAVQATANAHKKTQEIELQVLREHSVRGSEKLEAIERGKKEAEQLVSILQEQLVDSAAATKKEVSEVVVQMQQKLNGILNAKDPANNGDTS